MSKISADKPRPCGAGFDAGGWVRQCVKGAGHTGAHWARYEGTGIEPDGTTHEATIVLEWPAQDIPRWSPRREIVDDYIGSSGP